jgi:hypothetical protein
VSSRPSLAPTSWVPESAERPSASSLDVARLSFDSLLAHCRATLAAAEASLRAVVECTLDVTPARVPQREPESTQSRASTREE